MYCPKCGIRCAGSYCPVCGSYVKNQAPPPPPPPPPTPPRPSGYQQSPPYQPYQQQSTQYSYSYQQPMKWYKFLIYFELFALAVINVINGIGYLFGLKYGNSSDLVYKYYFGLKIVDVITGIECISFAIFAIYVRSRLANYCKDASSNLIKMRIYSIIINIAYAFFTGIIVSENVFFSPALLGNIIGSIIQTVLEYTYFDRRKELFIY